MLHNNNNNSKEKSKLQKFNCRFEEPFDFNTFSIVLRSLTQKKKHNVFTPKHKNLIKKFFFLKRERERER